MSRNSINGIESDANGNIIGFNIYEHKEFHKWN